MLQLACVLHMKDSITSSTVIRIFIVTENKSMSQYMYIPNCVDFAVCIGNGKMEKTVMSDFLKEARIEAEVHVRVLLVGGTPNVTL